MIARTPRLTSLLFILGGLLAAGNAGQAQTFEPEIWIHQCMPTGLGDQNISDQEPSAAEQKAAEKEAAEQETICTTEFATSNGEEDFFIYFPHNGNGKNPLVIAGGEERFASAVITVGKNDPVQADSCEAGLCYFKLKKSAALLKQFQKGSQARIVITAAKQRVILDTEISLRGFASAYKKFRR